MGIRIDSPAGAADLLADKVEFENDTDTFLSRSSDNTLSIYTSGSERAIFSSSGLTKVATLRTNDGSESDPAIKIGDAGAGFYKSANDNYRLRDDSGRLYAFRNGSFFLGGETGTLGTGNDSGNGTLTLALRADGARQSLELSRPADDGSLRTGSLAMKAYRYDGNAWSSKRLETNGNILTTSGSVSASLDTSLAVTNKLMFADDTDTFLSHSSDNTLSIYTSGSERAIFSSSGEIVMNPDGTRPVSFNGDGVESDIFRARSDTGHYMFFDVPNAQIDFRTTNGFNAVIMQTPPVGSQETSFKVLSMGDGAAGRATETVTWKRQDELSSTGSLRVLVAGTDT